MIEGRAERAEALRRYEAFSSEHEWKFKWMLRAQRFVPRVPPRALTLATRGMATRAFTHWAFGHYLEIAHPDFAGVKPPVTRTAHVRWLPDV